MINLLKTIAVILLLVNGTSALFGGGQLIMHPDGSSMDLSLSLLAHTPFHDYLVPGILLLLANGLCSFFVMALIVMDVRDYALFIIAQGIVLAVWVAVQVLLIRMVVELHVILGIMGLLLIAIGWILKTKEKEEQGVVHLRLS